MRLLTAFLVASAALAVGFLFAAGESSVHNHTVQGLEGTYDRTGLVDHAVEEQFKELGLVLFRPVLVDEFFVLPKHGTRDDAVFALRKRGKADYVLSLPKAAVVAALADSGRIVEMTDGSLLLRKPVVFGGEGSFDTHGDEEDRISREQRDGAEWLVIERRIQWTERVWFKKKKVEYRALVRFRAIEQNESTRQP